MALWLACALLATGCATPVAFRAPMAGPQTTCVTPAPERDLVVGVALSGGGSRAALFGASGLEALAQVRAPGGGSVLDQVTLLSSVSGGSVAASYYAMKKPSKETAVLGPNGTLTDDYMTFFAGYKDNVSQDFESALLWRQVERFRWILNPALAAQSLAELFAERLMGPVTFGDLSEPWTLGSYDVSRIPGIMEERATAYTGLFFRSLQIEGVFPDNQTLRMIILRHTDAQWKDDLSDLPQICREESPPLDSPTAVVERIAEIPTRFKLKSECDRQLLITAAAKVVAQNKQEIEDYLAGRPTQEGTAQ